MPSTVYTVDNVPETRAWIYELNAGDAVKQCQMLGITPAGTLEENRKILVDYHHRQTTTPNLAAGSSQTNTELAQEKLPKTHSDDHTVQNPNDKNETDTPATVSSDGATGLTPLQVAKLIQDTAIAVGAQFSAHLSRPVSQTEQPPAGMDTLKQLAQRVPITSGSNDGTLVQFLIGVSRVAKLGLTSDIHVLLAFLPRTNGQLRSLWENAIADHTPPAKVVSDTVALFFPPQMAHAMVSRMVYRPQRTDESLGDFVENIRDTAQLLLPSITEQELLETTLIGLNPTTRAALSGFPPPMNLNQLRNLIPRVSTINQLHSPVASSSREDSARQSTYQSGRYGRYFPSGNRRPDNVAPERRERNPNGHADERTRRYRNPENNQGGR